ncbi:hypothetical protein ACIBW9_38490 [Streptomyces sp. NPDC049541]|uniref:hypothetical protein n=1 Tax=Streptomyces sp. NPDC049541 TaxID=3365594 RepID=UPI00378F2E95
MRRMRISVVGVAALVMAAAVPGSAVGAPEADLAYHGVVSMAGGRVDLRLMPRNYGPSAVPDATVRLRWSVAPANKQSLPGGCVRSGERVMMCRVGALTANAVARQIRLRVRLRGAPSEVRVEIDTAWNGGAVDRHRHNDRQRVLVLATGDEYSF